MLGVFCYLFFHQPVLFACFKALRTCPIKFHLKKKKIN
jgi:hypothetical protein